MGRRKNIAPIEEEIMGQIPEMENVVEETIEQPSEMENVVEETIEQAPEIEEENVPEEMEALRSETIEKWEKSGLLEGLNDEINPNVEEILKSEQQQVVEEPVKKVDIRSLSRAQLRIYERTGILPK